MNSINTNHNKRMGLSKTMIGLMMSRMMTSFTAIRKLETFDTSTEVLWTWATSGMEMEFTFKNLILDRTGSLPDDICKLTAFIKNIELLRGKGLYFLRINTIE